MPIKDWSKTSRNLRETVWGLISGRSFQLPVLLSSGIGCSGRQGTVSHSRKAGCEPRLEKQMVRMLQKEFLGQWEVGPAKFHDSLQRSDSDSQANSLDLALPKRQEGSNSAESKETPALVPSPSVMAFDLGWITTP
jgi:hypothetical protein